MRVELGDEPILSDGHRLRVAHLHGGEDGVQGLVVAGQGLSLIGHAVMVTSIRSVCHDRLTGGNPLG